MSAQSMFNLALSQRLNDRSSLTLRVTDPFNQMGSTFESTNPLLQQVTERNFGARAVALSYTYNFGQQPRLQQRPAQTEEQES